jgi:hypothetical protein
LQPFCVNSEKPQKIASTLVTLSKVRKSNFQRVIKKEK